MTSERDREADRRAGESTAFTPPPSEVPARDSARYVRPHPSGVLVVRRGPQAGERFVVTANATTSLGRHRDCDIVLSDVTVSRVHAEIHSEHDRFVLIDAGSLNGTYLNRAPAVAAVLDDGDDIAIGVFRLTFHTSTDAPDVQPPEGGAP